MPESYGPSEVAVDAGYAESRRQGLAGEALSPRKIIQAAHDPALGDAASVNRGEHRREVALEIVAMLLANDSGRYADVGLLRSVDLIREWACAR
jgi:hypothetical protein